MAMRKNKGLLGRIRRITAPKDRAQLRDMLQEAGAAGLLDADGLSMLEGVLDVSDLQVRDIMVPHNQMTAVRVNDAPQHILSTAIDSGHSRFPVLDADNENIVGILLAKDLLRLLALERGANFNIRDWMRKAVFVPESKRVNVLLKELRMGRNHMAIAVDEYGSVAGLVTIEDVIEQIVGEIDDEHDVEAEKNIRRESDRQYALRGATRIAELNEFLGTSFSDADADTVAGLVTQAFGRLPRRGESVVIETVEFRVVRADRRRIEDLRMVLPDHLSVQSADAVAADTISG